MALSINAAPAAVQIPSNFAPPANAARPARSGPVAAQVTFGAPATSNAQQSAALNRLLNTYRNDQSHHAPTSTLSSLGRQIMAAAKAAGQRVTLPRGSPSAGATSATPVASPPPEATKVDVTA
jgi:hypothetical protein